MKKKQAIVEAKPDRNDPETWHIAIGKPAYEAIREMVDALSKETAARTFAETLDRDQCVKILTDEAGIECRDDEDDDTLREAVAVNIEDGTIDPEGFTFNEDEARERIQEDPLSVQVRSGWYTPGSDEGNDPEEFEILLGTGGPATRIVGDLDGRGQPNRARLEVQDWFKPWTEYFDVDRDVLLTYCQQFYFGE